MLTEVLTSSVYQTTVEVSYTPVYRTKVLTETQTVTRVESVPDVRVSLVTKSIYLPPTDYITVTEVKHNTYLQGQTQLYVPGRKKCLVTKKGGNSTKHLLLAI